MLYGACIENENMISEVIDMKDVLGFLTEYNFTLRFGKYFRIYGENILQSVGFRRERAFRYPVLNISFYSLYGEYYDKWCFTPFGHESGFPVTYLLPELRLSLCEKDVSIEESIEILMQYGLEQLNNIYYQKDIYTVSCMLYEKRFGFKSFSGYLVEPCLYAGLYEEALDSLNKLILMGIESTKAQCEDQKMSQTDIDIEVEREIENMKKYYEIKDLILTRNFKAIDKLLCLNLEKNLKHLKRLRITGPQL